MSDLAATPAFGLSPGRYDRAGGGAGVRVREINDRALVLVAARRERLDTLAETVRRQFGITLPGGPRLARGAKLAFLWNGEGQWLAMCDAHAVPTLEGFLRDEIGGLASLTDQSDGRAILEVGGDGINSALAKLVPLDLHPRAFRSDETALTLFGHIAGQLTKLDDTPSYEIMIPRSFAASFWRAWVDASAEFGVEVIRAVDAR